MKKYIFEPQQVMRNGKGNLKRYPSFKVWLDNDEAARLYACGVRDGMRTYQKFVQVLCCNEDGSTLHIAKAII